MRWKLKNWFHSWINFSDFCHPQNGTNDVISISWKTGYWLAKLYTDPPPPPPPPPPLLNDNLNYETMMGNYEWQVCMPANISCPVLTLSSVTMAPAVHTHQCRKLKPTSGMLIADLRISEGFVHKAWLCMCAHSYTVPPQLTLNQSCTWIPVIISLKGPNYSIGPMSASEHSNNWQQSILYYSFLPYGLSAMVIRFTMSHQMRFLTATNATVSCTLCMDYYDKELHAKRSLKTNCPVFSSSHSLSYNY